MSAQPSTPAPRDKSFLTPREAELISRKMLREYKPTAPTSNALIFLGGKLEAAQAAERAIDRDADWGAFEAAGEVTCAIVEQIASYPARTLDDLLVKMRAASWCRSGRSLADMLLGEFDCPEIDLTTDARIIVGILRDLETIAASQPQAATETKAA